MNERVNATGAAHSAAPASYNSRRWRITTWNCPSQKDASETSGLTGGQGEIRERRQTGLHESRHDSFGFGFGLFVGLTETGKVSTGLRGPARGQYKEADKTDTKTASHGRGKAPALHIMESGNWCSP